MSQRKFDFPSHKVDVVDVTGLGSRVVFYPWSGHDAQVCVEGPRFKVGKVKAELRDGRLIVTDTFRPKGPTGNVAVRNTGPATASGGGFANSGSAGTGPGNVHVENTGAVDATGGGFANSGVAGDPRGQAESGMRQVGARSFICRADSDSPLRVAVFVPIGVQIQY